LRQWNISRTSAFLTNRPARTYSCPVLPITRTRNTHHYEAISSRGLFPCKEFFRKSKSYASARFRSFSWSGRHVDVGANEPDNRSIPLLSASSLVYLNKRLVFVSAYRVMKSEKDVNILQEFSKTWTAKITAANQ